MTALRTLTCANCSTEFQRYQSSIKPGSQPYCSVACRGAGVGKGQKGSKRTFSADPMVTLTCTCCGAEFTRYRTQSKSKTGRNFCSVACQQQEGARPRQGDTRTCQQCPTTFYNKPGEDKKFCSVPCSNASRKVVYKGECQVCGAETSWDTPVRERKFCSVQCSAVARSRTAKDHRERRDCASCGNQFIVPTKRKGQLYCSRACIPHGELVGRTETACARCGDTFVHRASEERKYCSRVCVQLDATDGAAGHVNKQGYRMIRVNNKPIPEHRHVMEQMLGRPLPPNSTVHHKDLDKLNNAPDNLELWASRHPKGARVQDLVAMGLRAPPAGAARTWSTMPR